MAELTHGKRDGADTVIDITIGRAHRVRRDSENLPHSLLRPAERSNDLLVGLRRQVCMLPSVHRNLVSGHVLVLQDLGSGDGTRSDDEEGRGQILLDEVIEEARCVWRRSITTESVGNA